MKFTLDFLAKTAGLKDAAELSDKLGDSLDDTVDSGKQLAMAMRLAADKIEADLEQTRQIAGKLGDALGPELASKIGQSGLDDMAVKFRAAGLTIEDVDRNIDELADGVKRLDSAADAARNLDQSIAKVGTTTDNTRSVVANFTGNAMQEIPGVSGAMGPLNMAMGQFAEYAAEGNIGLSKFLGAGAAIGAVALVMGSMAKNAKLVAEAKAWRTDEIKAFVEAARNGEDATQALIDRLSEAGEITARFGGVLNELVGGDVVATMVAAGVSVDQFANAVTGGADGLAAFKGAMTAAGVGAGEIGQIMITAQASQENYTESLKVYDEMVKAGLAPSREAVAVANESAASHTRQQSALETLKSATEEMEQANRDLIASQLDLIGAQLSYEETVDRADDVVAAYNAVMADANSTLEQMDDSARDAQNALIGQAEGAAAAAGATDGSAESVRIQIGELERVAATLAPGSPLRMRLEDYIAALARIERSIVTNVEIRTKSVQAGVMEVDGGRAAGGWVHPGSTYSVNESTAETLTMGAKSGYVTPAGGGVGDPAEFGRLAAEAFARVLRTQMRAA